MSSLVKSGAIADDLLHQFNAAETELEAEMLDVVQEAESFQKGWGAMVLSIAAQMVGNMRQRDLREEMSRICNDSLTCNEIMQKVDQAILQEAEKENEAKRERLIKELIQEDEKKAKSAKKGVK